MNRERFDENQEPREVTPRANYLPCRECKRATPGAILAQYGALCSSCFAHYCTNGPTPRRRHTTPAIDAAREGRPARADAIRAELHETGDL